MYIYKLVFGFLTYIYIYIYNRFRFPNLYIYIYIYYIICFCLFVFRLLKQIVDHLRRNQLVVVLFMISVFFFVLLCLYFITIRGV